MPEAFWIDTHCHLDAPEFDRDRIAMRTRAARAGVRLCVIPAVAVWNFERVRAVAHMFGDAYALGIHPMCTPDAAEDALAQLDAALTRYAADPRLVAVGEIGLDYFVPALKTGVLRARQESLFSAQLAIALRHRLPMLLHTRHSAEQVLNTVQKVGAVGGIAHAFNGSRQQAERFLKLGFKLGFGGAMTYDRAARLRALAAELPADAFVMETDSPDIPPQWIYRTAAARAAGAPQGRNEPMQVPQIGAQIAALRAISADQWAAVTSANALQALPRLAQLGRGQMTFREAAERPRSPW